MPLTKDGNKVISNMVQQYGADKGKQVFYASINKGKPGSSKWHEKGSEKGKKFNARHGFKAKKG